MNAALMLGRILLVLLTGLVTSQAQTQSLPETINTAETYQQNSAVRSRYPDIAIELNAPSLSANKPGLTDHQSMMSFLAQLAAQDNTQMALVSAGRSQQNRDIPLLLFTLEGDKTLEAAALRVERPVIWFLGLQHGNEPAGGEAMLALAAELARPEAKDILNQVTIVIAPRVNPDGAAAFQRNTANRADPNRDHLLLFLPETRALHASMAKLTPDVVFDHHEFSVANRWIDKFGLIQSVDALLLHATHPMVPKGISELAEKLYRPAVEEAFKHHGLSSFWYYTTSNRRSDPVVSMGGNNPGIARNAMGLRGAVSFLIETRGVGIELEGWQRRVGTHVVAAKAVISATAREAKQLKAALVSERNAAAKSTTDLVVASRIPANDLMIPLLDPVSAETRMVSVKFQDSRIVEPTQTRPRAAGYIILRGGNAVLERFRVQGIAVCRLQAGNTVAVEAYVVSKTDAVAGRENINPDQTLHVSLKARDLILTDGAFYVPMSQVSAGIIAAVLEPDSPGSYLATGIVPLEPHETEAPIFRVLSGATTIMNSVLSSEQGVCGK